MPTLPFKSYWQAKQTYKKANLITIELQQCQMRHKPFEHFTIMSTDNKTNAI